MPHTKNDENSIKLIEMMVNRHHHGDDDRSLIIDKTMEASI